MTAQDAEVAFVWCSDERVNRFMPYNFYTNIDEATQWITEKIPQDENFNWGIVIKESKLL